MSSHQMASIEEFCTDILILNRGKTILKGNLQEIKEGYKANKLELITKVNVENEIKELGLKIDKKLDNRYDILIDDEEDSQRLLNLLISKNIFVEKLEVKKPSLNDIFIEKVGDK